MPLGSLLHAILSMTALHLELDSGELESLNSMIKSSMALANNSNMSLELLSARVNSRKAMTLASFGDTKLASLRPLASGLARASVLYQGFEQDTLDDVNRWGPAAPVDFASLKPAAFDPSLGLTTSHKWAVKYNRMFMKASHHRRKKNGEVVVFGMFLRFQSHESLYLVAELTGHTCQTIQLQAVNVVSAGREATSNLAWEVADTLNFEPSLCVIAGAHEHVLGKLHTVDLFIVPLHVRRHTMSPRLHYTKGTEIFVVQLRMRKEYQKRAPKPDVSQGQLEDGDYGSTH